MTANLLFRDRPRREAGGNIFGRVITRQLDLDLLAVCAWPHRDIFDLRIADIKAMGRRVEPGHPRGLRNRIKKVIREQDALHIRDLAVNGNDVMKTLNIKPGPEVGEVLNKLLDKVLDKPELNTKLKLIDLIQKLK